MSERRQTEPAGALRAASAVRRARRGGLHRQHWWLLLLLLGTGPVSAHKLSVFAWADGDGIQGEVYFAGGGKAAGVPVVVRNDAGAVLARLRSAADGRFGYAVGAAGALRVVAETPDGHRAEWRIAAAEFSGASRPLAEDPAHQVAAQPVALPPVDPRPATNATAVALDPALEAAIERAVARQVRPLRKEAQQAREVAQFRDVLGGIGYILGLAGLGLWWRCRHLQGSR